MDAKATAGDSLPGSLSVERSGFVASSSIERASLCAARVAASSPDSSFAISSLSEFDLTGQIAGAGSFGFQRRFGRGLPRLALVNQSAQPELRASKQSEIGSQTLAFADGVGADAHQIAEIAGNRFSLLAHVRQHRAEHDGGPDRAQCVLGLHQKRRRRLMANALQHREDFSNDRATLVKRLPEIRFPIVERFQARPCRLDSGLDIANAGRGIDELLIERATVLAQRIDLAFELRLAFRRLALLRADCIKLLIALPERGGVGLAGVRFAGVRFAGARSGRAVSTGRSLAGQVLGDERRRRDQRQRKRQRPSEHKARIGAARAKNHVVQG